jgi:hypothetical protein
MRTIVSIGPLFCDDLFASQYRIMIAGYAKNPSEVDFEYVRTSSTDIEVGFAAYALVDTTVRYGRPSEMVLQLIPSVVPTTVVPKTLVLLLKSGTYVCGPNLGHCFSFLLPYVDEVFEYPDVDIWSGSKALENSARMASHLGDYLEDELDLREMSSDLIIGLSRSDHCICSIRQDGTLVTTLKAEDLKGKKEYGEKVRVCIGEHLVEVAYVQDIIHAFGQPALVVGRYGGDAAYLELIGVHGDFVKTLRPGVKISLV